MARARTTNAKTTARKPAARKGTTAKRADKGKAAGPLRRNALPLAGALVGGLAAAAAALFLSRRDDGAAQGQRAADLEGDTHPGPDDRADPHFRPDMAAPMSAADREALTPPLGRPTLVDG